MGRSRAAIPLALFALAGCGGESAETSSVTRAATKRLPTCTSPRNAPTYRTCWYPGRQSGPSTLERRDAAGDWKVLARPPAGPVSGEWHGQWIAVYPSPDGKTLLAQWSGECEIPTAFFVLTDGGSISTVLDVPYADAPESVGKGWAADGRARVEFWKGYCGKGVKRPGLYLVDPDTRAFTFVRPLKRRS